MQIATTVQSNKAPQHFGFLTRLKNKEFARKTILSIAAKDRLKQLHDAHFATRRRRRRKNDSRFTTDRSRWVAALTDVSFLEGRDSFERLRADILKALSGF
ncbi:hypothetical protein BJP08_10760 [Corynebacterium sp. NML140438]|uniref:hypothetical protein n=1 Tax=Corynebacterium sp. NML140438 TaxID=1906334 RepID=UPI0008FB92AA|nr:hypothetical protein [Corynebacterium sp. NML140438]OIR40417.1 hypothetical protein BJP08_10760 [Corynebacterium sp. NML140438]